MSSYILIPAMIVLVIAGSQAGWRYGRARNTNALIVIVGVGVVALGAISAIGAATGDDPAAGSQLELMQTAIFLAGIAAMAALPLWVLGAVMAR